jgi:hypothetical protein
MVLAAISGGGGLAFLPFLSASSGKPITGLIGFAVVVLAVCTLAAWIGLRCADAAQLPMPYLGRLDGRGGGKVPRAALPVTLLVAVPLGALAVLALRVSDAPALPGGTMARALSALFAAGPLEIVLHLLIMSAVVRVARQRWVGIVGAALALVLFHLSDATTMPPAAIAAAVIGNGSIGVALGWLYAAYGFEFVMIGHAVAHLIAVLCSP